MKYNALNADYSKIKNAAVLRKHINDQYLDCNENFRVLEVFVCLKTLKH